MLTCKDAARACSDEFERPLNLRERASLRLHLMMCSGCSNYRVHLGVLQQAMQAYADGRADSGQAEPEIEQDG